VYEVFKCKEQEGQKELYRLFYAAVDPNYLEGKNAIVFKWVTQVYDLEDGGEVELKYHYKLEEFVLEGPKTFSEIYPKILKVVEQIEENMDPFGNVVLIPYGIVRAK